MTTFDKLQADVIAYLEDDGDEFKAELPVIVDTAHRIVARGMDLNIFSKEKALSMTVGQNWLDLTGMDALHVDYGVYPTFGELERRSLGYIDQYRGMSRPRYFADRDGKSIWLSDKPDSSYTVLMRYLSAPAKLSAIKEDWFTQYLPDVMLKACIVEACRYLKMIETVGRYEADLTGMMQLARRDHSDMVRTERAIL